MKKLVLSLLCPGLLLSANVMAETSLDTDKDKLSYSLGVLVGERVLKKYKDLNYEVLIQALKNQHLGQPTLMSLPEASLILDSISKKREAKQYEETIRRGESYLKSNAQKKDVTVTDSGLQYAVMTVGKGAKPSASDRVTVHYRGTLLDGNEFDSSYSRGQPATFKLNQVIKGWTEGVQLMNVGSKYRFVIPSDLAYGARGTGSSIGPHETLIFEVELIAIN